VLLAAIGTSLPDALEAQRIDSPYRFVEASQSIGVFAGQVVTGQNALELGPGDALVLGARYGIRIGGPFLVEAEAAFLPATRDVFAVDSLAADSTDRALIGMADMALLLVGAQLRFNLTGSRTWRGIQPFILAGGGVAIDLAASDEIEADLPRDDRFDFGTSFAGELGAGVEWFLSDRFSIRADVREHFWQLETPSGFSLAPHGEDLAEDEWIGNFRASAGISIHF
jgi:hypothetical protein